MIRTFYSVLVVVVMSSSSMVAGEPFGEPPASVRQAIVPESQSIPVGLPKASVLLQPVPPTHDTTLLVPVAPRAYRAPVFAPAVPRLRTELTAERLAGMRQALEILESNNHHAAAAELRNKITELRLDQVLRQLDETTATLAKLQAEIYSLRSPEKSTQVQLSFQVLELSQNKLRNSGIDSNSHDFLSTKRDSFAIGHAESEKVAEVIDALKQNGIASVLAEPTLVSVCGHEVNFRSGGEVTVPLPATPDSATPRFEQRPIGTLIRYTPLMQADGSLQIELDLRHTELDHSHDAKIENLTIPGFRTRQVNTTLVCPPGQSAVLRGLKQKRVEKVAANDGKITEHVDEFEAVFIVSAKYNPTDTR